LVLTQASAGSALKAAATARPWISIHTQNMTARKHFELLVQALFSWFAFWVVGLPSYYQQYCAVTMAVAMILLSVAISLAAVFVLRRGCGVR
jgi:hypothetical protein